jgi:NitT/TauT family transport system ATP-binding protein
MLEFALRGPEGAATPDPPPHVQARGLTRVFDNGRRTVHAMGPLDLQIGRGEFVCLVGPSGCGKSTFLRLLAGLVRPSEGTLRIEHHEPERPLFGMVFQDHSIYPWKTVADNVRFALDVQKHGRPSKAVRAERVASYLQRLGLTEFADAYPATLSGGMRQRVSIARALAIEPEIILMDEPFASLDAQLRTILQNELVSLWEAERRTVVFITHSIDEALFLGDRVVLMTARPGRFLAEYPVPFERPRDAAIRGSAEFARLQQEIWSALSDEVNQYMAQLKGGRDD